MIIPSIWSFIWYNPLMALKRPKLAQDNIKPKVETHSHPIIQNRKAGHIGALNHIDNK